MKCYHHNANDAVGICVNCGKALCKECTTETENKKVICSPECGIAINNFDKSIEIIQSKILKQSMTAAYGLYICSLVFGLFGLYNLIFKSSHYIPIGIFLILTGVVFFVWGTWDLKLSNKSIS